MLIDDTDRLVAATLAGAWCRRHELGRHLDYVLMYERMLKIIERRKASSHRATAAGVAAPTAGRLAPTVKAVAPKKASPRAKSAVAKSPRPARKGKAAV